MKTVSILVPENAVPAAIVDPQYMFSAINMFYKNAGQPPFFNVQLVGLNRDIRLNNGSVSFHPDALIQDVAHTDLIIIPAISGDIEAAIAANKDFFPWIVSHHRRGAEVASLCIGAFLLASTGLLRGKACSTHWLHAAAFKRMFPDVKMADDRVITDQNGLYTSGGANAYWNLLLYLVEKYTHREMAIMASKYFLLDTAKKSQLPFAMFKGQKNHGDDLVLAAQEYIENHFESKISVEWLADRFGVGRRTFERRFKKNTANSIIEYIQRVRIEAAKLQLEDGQKQVNEVMYAVGYNDPKAFREVFKKYTDMSPVDYRQKYTTEVYHLGKAI
jgi:transcriptional regulator GlxA family with amidase domain